MLTNAYNITMLTTCIQKYNWGHFNFLLKNQKLFSPCFMRHYFNFFQAWNVNWETRHMMIQFEDDKNVIFQVNLG